jgi:Flp pilus assembly protein TadD
MPASTITAESVGLEQDGARPLRLMVEAGEFLYYTSRFEESDKVFRALSLAAPEDPLGVLGLARNAIATGQFKLAIEYVSQAIRCHKAEREDLARGQLYLGDANMGLGRFREADRAWRSALELGGSDMQLGIDVGWRLKQVRQALISPATGCVTSG